MGVASAVCVPMAIAIFAASSNGNTQNKASNLHLHPPTALGVSKWIFKSA